MNPWRCERCEAMGVQPHSFDETEPDAKRDPAGRLFVPGFILAPTARGALADDQSGLSVCPELAMSSWLRDLLQLWRRCDGELADVPRLVDAAPSAALWDAWDLMAAGFRSLREVLTERAEKRAGAAAAAAGKRTVH